MRSSSHPALIERAKPLFGTIVRVRAGVAEEQAGQNAASAAFQAMRRVHDLMSFHDEASDLSRLNRQAAMRAVPVDPMTVAVLELALEIAEATGGAFDPTVAPQAVALGDLPRPTDAPDPDGLASWRDIEIDASRGLVRFHRKLWIDLGGVAKGWAVDLACATLAKSGVEQGTVDASGDLRVFGPMPERVAFDVEGQPGDTAPVVEIQDGAVAGSGPSARASLSGGDVACHAHFDGRDRMKTLPKRFAGVVAERCAVADALTKIVLADGEEAAGVLARYGAFACLYDPDAGWRVVGQAS